MATLQEYLAQCPFLKEIELDLARMNRWKQVAVKLAPYSKTITGSWLSAIECSSDNDMGKSKAFLQAVSDPSLGITASQFAKGLYQAGLQVIALKVDPDARS